MKNYLPIGSVVLLTGGSKPLMIYGRYVRISGEQLIYDYLGCVYPEGHLTDKQRFLFNHEDIVSILFRGYSDAQEEAFVRNVLNKQDSESNGYDE